MEEEINYSSVVFKNGGRPPKEKEDEATVYAEVKPKGPADTKPNGGRSHVCVLVVCLVIICVLLVASISAIIYITSVMNEQKANLSGLAADNRRLTMERSALERNMEELSRITGNLNRTLNVILDFDTFPVNEYCPEKKCQPCKKDWVHFQDKCYLFYNEVPPWKEWDKSRKFCQDAKSDLVVIDSFQEQKFISNGTKYYEDKFHGFWIGLVRTDDKDWRWVDGSNATLCYWMSQPFASSGPFVLMIPGEPPTANWDSADLPFQNKFICENEALVWSN